APSSMYRFNFMNDVLFVFYKQKTEYEINEGLIMRPGQVLTKALVVVEDKVIDGAVNGLGATVKDSSTGLGRAQTGYARTYALTMLFGAVIVAATLVVRF